MVATDQTPSAPAVAIFGLGKAGAALANSLCTSNAKLVAVFNRGDARRAAFLQKHPQGVQVFAQRMDFFRALNSAQVDLLFLAVPDDELERLALDLQQESWLPPNIAHLSGARGAEVLHALEPRVQTAAFHPLAALRADHPIPPGALLAIDSDDRALHQKLADLATAMELEPACIRRGQHARYHAGAVVSANLAVALLHHGMSLLQQAGISEPQARRGLAHLLGSTADAARERPLAEMLTGPVARGDAGTLRRHLDVLDDPITRSLYVTLSQQLLEVASLTAEQKTALNQVLQGHPVADGDTAQSLSDASAAIRKK